MSSAGSETPLTFKISQREAYESIKDKRQEWVLKQEFSRFGNGVYFLKASDPLPENIIFVPQNSWLLQEKLNGTPYCSYSVCRKGSLLAHSCYTPTLALKNNASRSFKSVEHPVIEDWVARFVKEIDFSGQISFDFIVEESAGVFCIECNPRATSGVHLFRGMKEFAWALTQPDKIEDTVKPVVGREAALKAVIAFEALLAPGTLSQSLQQLFKGKDVVFSGKDVLPSLASALPMAEVVYTALKNDLSLTEATTYHFEWNQH